MTLMLERPLVEGRVQVENNNPEAALKQEVLAPAVGVAAVAETVRTPNSAVTVNPRLARIAELNIQTTPHAMARMQLQAMGVTV